MRLALLAAVLALPAAADTARIAADAHVTEVLVAARVGDVIRKTCPSITARMFVVWDQANQLKAYALAQGYGEPEVKAFLKDKDQKARIAALGASYLKAAGAREGDVESYCAAGRGEIAAGSLAGSLIRSWK